MTLPVSIKDVVDELEMVSDEMTGYINRDTGELYSLSQEDIDYAEGDEDEAPD